MNRRRGFLAALTISILIAAACGGGDGSSSQAAEDGDTVSVFYTGTLDDGSEFDSNVGGSPLVFTLGEGSLIDGFENAVRGKRVGETLTVRLEPADAYGEWSQDNVFDVPAEGAPEGLQVGDTATLQGGIPVTIVAISETAITVDANHPLAGEALTFEIEIVDIQ